MVQNVFLWKWFVVLALAAGLAAGCGGRKATMRIPRVGDAESGVASWYGVPYHGRQAASGETYDMEQLTAAHRTLPFHTWVRVRNLDNGHVVEVRINDRGPFVGRRVIDLSLAAARLIEMVGPGTARVRLEVIRPPQVAPRTERFAVQVGAFTSRGNAEQMQRKVQSVQQVARLVTRAGEPVLHRVLVGEFGSRGEAEAVAEELRRQGFAGLAVRLDE